MIVFGSVLFVGILGIAALKSGHADEMLRLNKQKRRLAERDRDRSEEDNIFTTQRDDYLSRILALAGLEAQYDKHQWCRLRHHIHALDP